MVDHTTPQTPFPQMIAPMSFNFAVSPGVPVDSATELQIIIYAACRQFAYLIDAAALFMEYKNLRGPTRHRDQLVLKPKVKEASSRFDDYPHYPNPQGLLHDIQQDIASLAGDIAAYARKQGYSECQAIEVLIGLGAVGE